VPMSEWKVLQRDRFPAYITWERYLANQQRLGSNRSWPEAPGVPRAGAALLPGLLVCGACGRRMHAGYRSKAKPYYECMRRKLEGSSCRGLGATAIDDLVGQQVLRALEPAALELSLRAQLQINQERERLHRQWQLRLERAAQTAQRAERQYHAVEPENRLVAVELEHRWEQALRDERTLQEEYDRFVRERPRALSDGDRALIRSLASDLPRLWQADTTTAADRQTIIRLLVRQIVVQAQGSTEHVDVTIHWSGGFASIHRVRRPVARRDQLSNHAQLMERVVALRQQGRTAPQIAATLNEEGFIPPKRRTTYNDQMVRELLARSGLSSWSRSRADGGVLGANEWWLNQLASELGMPQITLHSWVRRGWVSGRKLPGGSMGRWVVWADGPELDRLRRLRACPRGWSDEPYPAELTTPRTRPEGCS